MNRTAARLATLALAATLLAGGLSAARGATRSWSVPAGQADLWSTPSNWGGLVPTGSDAVFINNGGTATLTTVQSCGTLTVGNTAGGGTVVMTSGALTTLSNAYVGNSGAGSFAQSGGSNTVNANFYLGFSSGIGGSYDLSGASLLSASNAYLGYSGTGTLTQSGGTVSVANTLTLGNSGVGSAGIYNFNGGVLTAKSIARGTGTAIFNFNGGTLRAAPSASTSFLGGLTSAYVQSGGVIVDTNGQGVTISQSLLDGGGSGGFTKSGSGNLTLSGTNTFTGPTLVSQGTLTVGSLLALQKSTLDTSGSGIFSFDSLTAATLGGLQGSGGLTLRNTSSTAVALTVGGNNTSTIYSGGLSGSGSLTKIGAGMLTLAGSNGYSGNTTISGGTLNIVGSLTSGSLTANNGGSVSLSGSLNQTNESIGTPTGGAGLLQQNGGSNVVSLLSIGNSGSYILGGGSLQVNNLMNQGTFAGSAAPATLAAGGILDLTVGTWHGLANVNLNMGGNSLLIVPVGFDPAASGFATFSSLGLTHTIGTTLTVPAGQGFVGMGSIADPVDCQGSILAASGGGISLKGGLTVSGTGSMSLGAGTLTTNNAFSGISGGSVAVSSHSVGSSGTGTFSQSGGKNSIANALVLGSNPGGIGTYNMSGSGYLSVPVAYVGNSGVGSFLQSGGTSNISNSLNLGSNAGSSGVYDLRGSGYLSVYLEYLGYSGTGNFIQAGGTNNVSSRLELGVNSGSSATYSLSGNGYLSAPSIFLGYSGTGSFTQSGGSNSNSSLYLGNNVGSKGTYNLSGSGYLSSNFEIVGYSGTGIFTQSGGTNSIINDLWLAYNTGSGTYNLTDSGFLFCDLEVVATGSFMQSGRTYSAINTLNLGNNAGSSGTYNLSGSGYLSSHFEAVGVSGTGSFTQSGGTHITNYVAFGSTVGSTGTYSLNGGLLTTGSVSRGSGSGTFNFNGGTLQASGNCTGFVSGLTATYVQAGGAIIDVQGFSDTIGQNLLHDVALGASLDGGLIKLGSGILTLTGTNFFNGVTTINAGTLNILSDAALGAVPSVPAANILFSGDSTLQVGAPMTLAANRGISINSGVNATIDTKGNSVTIPGMIGGSGNLAKAGSGRLTLAATDTYTGMTIVKGGTLQVTGAILNNGSNKVVLAKDVDGIFGNGNGDARIVRRVPKNGSYAGLGSSVANLGPGELPSRADVLDGIASAQADVGMAWRTRGDAERSLPYGGLISEIVDLNGMALSGIATYHGSSQTDSFVLQESYDPAQAQGVTGFGESDAAAQGLIYLGHLDLGPDGLPGTADDAWTRAVDGNFGGLPNFVGAVPYDAGFFVLGDYGVDTVNHVVWAVVNHNSQFASFAVPEPGTLALLAAAAAGLAVAWRRRVPCFHDAERERSIG